MAPLAGQDHLLAAIKMAKDRTGRGMILVDTPVINVCDTAAARQEARHDHQAHGRRPCDAVRRADVRLAHDPSVRPT